MHVHTYTHTVFFLIILKWKKSETFKVILMLHSPCWLMREHEHTYISATINITLRSECPAYLLLFQQIHKNTCEGCWFLRKNISAAPDIEFAKRRLPRILLHLQSVVIPGLAVHQRTPDQSNLASSGWEWRSKFGTRRQGPHFLILGEAGWGF